MKGYLDYFIYNPEKPFLFSQPAFWIFFILTFSIFVLLYKRIQLRNGFLFLASLFFYYKTGGLFILLLLFSVLLNFFLGIRISRSAFKRKTIWLITGIIANLSILFYYKYIGFFTSLINQWMGSHIQIEDYIAILGNHITGMHFDIASIALPVGISFFTFHALSYIIDIYHNKVKPANNILDFGFYIAFFPQLVAGPIIRASEFIPQISRKFSLTGNEFSHALFLILNGLIKKMIISDFISLNFVDRVFDNPQMFSGVESLFAVYGYAVQIYCDFSGYTDIAIGLALILGFRIPINFNSPYKAQNLIDFWRRWHISLSSWLRDYLYISLGGNRKGKILTQVNVLITMLLGGLWHGANLKFLIWGALHGIGLVFNKLISGIGRQSAIIPLWKKLAGGFVTFHFVCFAWIFFRAENMDAVKIILQNIFLKSDFSIFPKFITEYFGIIILIAIAMIIHWLPSQWKEWYRGKFILTPFLVKMIITLLIILLIYQFRTSDIQPFIYFQF
jgi:alginate O-acetyltransferase complex protein AlgI